MSERIDLAPDEVHVWIEILESNGPLLAEAHSILSREENDRADRFVQKIHQDRFHICHLKKRQILSRYVGISPRELQFTVNEFGKPSLDSNKHSTLIGFNLSHSAERMLLGIVPKGRIGVDIEEIRPESAQMDVAERFFTERENIDLRSLAGFARVEGFFNCWTRKEAYLKGLGYGLSIDPKDCEVTLLPGEPPLIRALAPKAPGESWNLHSLRHGGYLCAIAIDRSLLLKQKSG
ncbi:MAG TPA: 4'-phosphopantetheinyl transferase superfamily protein [Candidatus Kapabacteria bacterium]|nr:4'-phosphopantetheinyl transferase superfamily protein [Candidatus Kapabacteria bacterium]